LTRDVGFTGEGTPLVSVCVPTFRRPVELEQAITSILEQSYSNFEVVVSDDSGDQEEVVRRLDDHRIRYFKNEPHAGMGGNFNLSLDRARGELIGFLHDDDRWLPQFLDRVVGRFKADPSLDLVFTNHYLERSERPGHRQLRSCALAAGTYNSFLSQLLRYQPVAISAALMRRPVWERVRPLPNICTSDAALFVRIAEAGYAFYYLDEPLMIYRIHPGQHTRREIASREDGVKLWEDFHFDDPKCERMRRGFLAQSLLSLAASRMKQGRYEDARSLALRARTIGIRGFAPRLRTLASVAEHETVARLAARTWRRLHPGASLPA
jgi:glycosyltransferase involved in cell wall biosynthesis